MATKKPTKSTTPPPAPPAKPVIDGFGMKTSTDKPSKVETVATPANIRIAVDEFVKYSQEMKRLEAEQGQSKKLVNDYCFETYTKRMMTGSFANFRLAGDETTALYIVMDKSSSIAPDDYDKFELKHGIKAAEELLVQDLASFRINPEAMALAGDRIREVFSQLSTEIGVKVLQKGSFKTTDDAALKARSYAKTPDELAELIIDMKITKYVRS